MTSSPIDHDPIEHKEKCPLCGSYVVNLDWTERLNPHEVQCLWKCFECKNEFSTRVASEEKPLSETEIIEPFISSLVIE